jgi:hypothetical protein
MESRQQKKLSGFSNRRRSGRVSWVAVRAQIRNSTR